MDKNIKYQADNGDIEIQLLAKTYKQKTEIIYIHNIGNRQTIHLISTEDKDNKTVHTENKLIGS